MLRPFALQYHTSYGASEVGTVGLTAGGRYNGMSLFPQKYGNRPHSFPAFGWELKRAQWQTSQNLRPFPAY
jgi:hypothetical protein